MLRLRYYGDPILREKAAPVGEITDELRELAREMLVVMYREVGVGLAAPQVGVLQRLIVVDPEPDEGAHQPMYLVNPEIIDVSDDDEWIEEEGCLSLPEIHGDVPRAGKITVVYTDLDGNEQTLDADGWLARVIQHEVDHLNGVLFLDHLSPFQRRRLKNPLKRLQKIVESGGDPKAEQNAKKNRKPRTTKA